VTRPDLAAIRAKASAPKYAMGGIGRAEILALVARVKELERALRDMLFPEPPEFDRARAVLADADSSADPAPGSTKGAP